MTNIFPRTITPEEIQVGDCIRIKWSHNDIAYSRTFTVARIEDDGGFLTPEGNWTCAGPDESIILLDRPDWVADGICMDADGYIYTPKGDSDWPTLPKQYAPYRRHPAVVAAEKRGELRVLDAVREGVQQCDIERKQGIETRAYLRELLDGWAS